MKLLRSIRASLDARAFRRVCRKLNREGATVKERRRAFKEFLWKSGFKNVRIKEKCFK